MIFTKILGTGSYLPKKSLSNKELEDQIDTTDQWIIDRTGIHSRHIAAEDESTLSMAKAATLKALEAANVAFSEIDMIIVASSTPENVFPGTACLLQKAFDIGGVPAFDLQATACAGFVYGLGIADKFIRSGSINRALVVGSEVMSSILDWQDRATCILFGDGAGAVVVGADEKPGIISTHLNADGCFADILYMKTSMGKVGKNLLVDVPRIQMRGNALFKLAVNILGDLFDRTLEEANVSASAIDWLIPHQANIRIIQAMAKKLALPMKQVVATLQTHGNTSSASIPLALDTAVRDGRIKRGDMLLLEGFGGGLAWGSALVRY